MIPIAVNKCMAEDMKFHTIIESKATKNHKVAIAGNHLSTVLIFDPISVFSNAIKIYNAVSCQF